jgi:hypothetical protein
MHNREATLNSPQITNFELVISQLSSLSITSLSGLLDTLIGQVFAIEGVLNRPAYRDQDATVIHDILAEADNRLQATADELRSRRAADDEERDVRFRALLGFASMTCVSHDDLAEHELTEVLQ